MVDRRRIYKDGEQPGKVALMNLFAYYEDDGKEERISQGYRFCTLLDWIVFFRTCVSRLFAWEGMG